MYESWLVSCSEIFKGRERREKRRTLAFLRAIREMIDTNGKWIKMDEPKEKLNFPPYVAYIRTHPVQSAAK